MSSRSNRRARSRPGVAAMEFAVLLPFLVTMAFGIVDFCRLFYCSVIVTDCAMNGAIYSSQVASPTANSPYANVTAAAQAESGDLPIQPTISSAAITDSDGHAAITVTATYTFTTAFPYPFIPSSVTISRTVQMRKLT